MDRLPRQQHALHLRTVRLRPPRRFTSSFHLHFVPIRFSADQNTVSNQTNLALKGIVAIKAMSQLSTALGNGADAQLYAVSIFPSGARALIVTLHLVVVILMQTESTNLFAQWESLAVDPSTHALLDAFGQSSSFTLGYNLFADLWLGTNLVNSTVRRTSPPKPSSTRPSVHQRRARAL